MGEDGITSLNYKSADLEAIATQVREVASQRRGDALQLLALLRMLESIHQEIQDGPFQECLPNNRQALYNMLRDMESEGGWPYIPRMKLRSLIYKLLSDFDQEDGSSEHENSLNR